jgi:hypothetical protein
VDFWSQTVTPFLGTSDLAIANPVIKSSIQNFAITVRRRAGAVPTAGLTGRRAGDLGRLYLCVAAHFALALRHRPSVRRQAQRSALSR